MNDEQDSPSIDPELEVRIVALLQGEASDFERDELNRLIKERPEVASFKKELERLHERLRDVGMDEWVDESADWKLSPKRRNLVLATMSGEAIPTADVKSVILSPDPELVGRRKIVSNALKIAAILFLPLCFVGTSASWFMARSRFMADSRYQNDSRPSSVATNAMVDRAGEQSVDSSVPASDTRWMSQVEMLGAEISEDEVSFSGEAASKEAGVSEGYAESPKSNLSEIRRYLDVSGTTGAEEDAREYDAKDNDAASLGFDAMAVQPSPYYRMDAVEYFPSDSKQETPQDAYAADAEMSRLRQPSPGSSGPGEGLVRPNLDDLAGIPLANQSRHVVLPREEFEERTANPMRTFAAPSGGESGYGGKADSDRDAGIAGFEMSDSKRLKREKANVLDFPALGVAKQKSIQDTESKQAQRPISGGATIRYSVDPQQGNSQQGNSQQGNSPSAKDGETRDSWIFEGRRKSNSKASDISNFRALDQAKSSDGGEQSPRFGLSLPDVQLSTGAIRAQSSSQPSSTNGIAEPAAPAKIADFGSGVETLSIRASDQGRSNAEQTLEEQSIDGLADGVVDKTVQFGRGLSESLVEKGLSSSNEAPAERQEEMFDKRSAPKSAPTAAEPGARESRETFAESAAGGGGAELWGLREQSQGLSGNISGDTAAKSPRIAGGFEKWSDEGSSPGQRQAQQSNTYAYWDRMPSTQNAEGEESVEQRDFLSRDEFDRRFLRSERQLMLEDRFDSKAKKPASKIVPAVGLDEKEAAEESFSTFSLHVSDVSFKLAKAALAKGEWPDSLKVRIEEFVNAFDYGDPMPNDRERVACRVEQSVHPFLQQRNLMRVSMRTAAAGRASTTPLRLTFLLDNSGSMERFDRQQTVRRAFALLAQQLKPIDQVTLISFARQPRLLADKVSGSESGQLVQLVDQLPSEGGTNLESALQLAFEKAREQQIDDAQNRVILLTDGAVNLGDANPQSLARMIEFMRGEGIAFDAAGISAEGLNDEVLESLARKGDGRYYLLDSPEAADEGFVRQIAGALRPSAKNVKVQIQFNPRRVGRYKLLGFEKHRLAQEDFRNDQVDAAEMAAEEAGVAVYQFEAKPDGEGDVGFVSVRFQDVSTGQMVEESWPIPYEPGAVRLDQAAPSLRIAASAALLAAALKGETLGETVDLKALSQLIAGLPAPDRSKRVQALEQMIRQARQVSGR
ncbi:MAG: vWA domain-containing protein [Rubripirellula sp.]